MRNERVDPMVQVLHPPAWARDYSVCGNEHAHPPLFPHTSTTRQPGVWVASLTEVSATMSESALRSTVYSGQVKDQ
jgi:hypothetical protein